MKYTGKIKIEQGLELIDPTLEFKNILVEGLFTDDNGDKHSRMYKLDVDLSDLSTIDVQKGIDKDELLKSFK